MFLNKTPRIQKWLVGAFALLFVWMVFTCVHNANPADHSKDVAVSCDLSTVVAQVTCTQDSLTFLLLTLLVGLGFAWTASGYPRKLTNVLFIKHWLPAVWINRPAFSPLLEMFRKGIIHPKLYSTVVS